MTTFDTHAISLRATPFQETDQIVSYYSAEYGEIRAIVKGAKKPKRQAFGRL